jgi:hypothetical protein
MFTRNDEGKRWVNGSLGRVISVDGNTVRVELLTDHPGNVCEVSPVRWENYSYRLANDGSRIDTKVTGEYEQYPLMLAWAVTIHKAQGKTLEKLHIDFGHGTFDSGQAYVAFSRCRTLNGITLERPVRKDDITCSQVLKVFSEGVQSQIPDIYDLARQTSKGPNVEGDYDVVGLRYGECNKGTLKPPMNATVRLVPDPLNQHDHNAVRIEWSGHMVGHIPRSRNGELSRVLQQGTALSATITQVRLSATDELLGLTIRVRRGVNASQ